MWCCTIFQTFLTFNVAWNHFWSFKVAIQLWRCSDKDRKKIDYDRYVLVRGILGTDFKNKEMNLIYRIVDFPSIFGMLHSIMLLSVRTYTFGSNSIRIRIRLVATRKSIYYSLISFEQMLHHDYKSPRIQNWFIIFHVIVFPCLEKVIMTYRYIDYK